MSHSLQDFHRPLPQSLELVARHKILDQELPDLTFAFLKSNNPVCLVMSVAWTLKS